MTRGKDGKKEELGIKLFQKDVRSGIVWVMVIDYYFNEAAFKHGIAEIDIRMAFSRPLFDGLIEGCDNKFLLTGFDTRGNILEIMYNLIDEHTAHVFHAMRCRKAYRLLRNQN